MSRYLRAAYQFMASRRLAVTLMISWTMLLVVWLIPFIIYGLPAQQIERIVTGEFFFRLVYVALLVATAACMAARLPGLVRLALREPQPTAKPRIGGAPQARVSAPWSAERASSVAAALRIRRFVSGDRWAWGVRNRMAPFGTVVFHLSFFLIVGAAWLALQPSARFEGKTAVSVGETFNSTTQDAFTDLITPNQDPPALSFTVESFEPRFYRDILLFTRLQGIVIDGAGRSHRVAVGHPWIVSPTTLLSLEDFGYSADAQVTQKDGTLVGPFVFKLKVFPAQMQDSFNINGTAGTYRVDAQVYGDYVDRDGVPGTASFNLSDPRLLITVNRILTTGMAQPVVKERLVALGEEIEIDGDILVINGLPYYGVFRVSRLSSAPFALIGVVLLVTGAVMRLVFPRVEILIAEDEDGVVLFVRDQTYQHAPALVARAVQAWEGAE